MSSPEIDIEVAYAGEETQAVVRLKVPDRTSIAEAIGRSGLLQDFSEIDLNVNKVGIFAELRGLDSQVQPGDRVEIYRPLITNPKEARRRRATGARRAR